MSTDKPAQIQAARTVALRFALLELLIVLAALVFVRKEIYLAGVFKALQLHWQEYVLLLMMFVDGFFRGAATVKPGWLYLNPLHKRVFRYLLPIMLFLFVSCSSLCDKLNFACIQQEWWRDTGLAFLVMGMGLSVWEQKTRPQGLESSLLVAANKYAATKSSGGVIISSKRQLESIAKSAAELSESNSSPAISNLDTIISNQQDAIEIVPSGPWKSLRYPDRSAVLLELVGISMIMSAWLPLLTFPGLIVAFKWELQELEAFRIEQFGEKYLAYQKKTWCLIPYIC